MKSSDNTEMERLMRRFARRSGEASASASDSGEESTTVHLDADEVNAYAEGALPQSARSRYFAHLADCDSCRKLVTDLTLAATSAEAAKERVASIGPSQGKSWREWLSAIFSPPVLRFGVPALALSVVIVVAIVATRTQRDESAVAQKNEAGRQYSPSIAANTNSTAGAEQDRLADHNQSTNTASSNVQTDQRPTTTTAAAPSPVKAGSSQEASPSVPAVDVAKPAATPAPSAPEGGVFGEIAKRAERDVSVAQSQPPPPAPGVTMDEANRDKQDDQKKAKVAGKDEDSVSSKSAGGAVATESRANESRPATGRRAAPTQNLPMTTAAPPRREQRIELAEERERASETRSAGGRKFRRQGSAWVDTAYKSSLPTTNVARGSEQYRALVADEPSLRAITQQLGGEVVVVWKSRAYRFY